MPPHRSSTRLECAGCGARIPDGDRAFRCPNSNADDTDHVVVRRLDPAGVRLVAEPHPNPFARYREPSHAYQLARSRGDSDADWVARVERIDRAIAAVAGHGFSVTPFARADALGRELGCGASGGVWIKDETGNVAGSHKARHLMGLALLLDVLRATRPAQAEPAASRKPLAVAAGEGFRLAIASCGNAALAAAVVARALGWPLEVFVPPDAEPRVLESLTSLGAEIALCPRKRGTRGDPCMVRFREAVASGAIPFCCQGSENGLTIEGGATLGYEIVEALAARGEKLDRVFVQVGGGALASAVAMAFDDARALGAIAEAPRLMTVQTVGARPLQRAYDRVRARALRDLGAKTAGSPPGPASAESQDALEDDRVAADLLRTPGAEPAVTAALAHAARHRSEYMWPWETVPASVARGILDDETYDWLAVIRGMIRTGGWPIVVDEPLLIEARTIARRTRGIPVSATGAAGLAGLLALRRIGIVTTEERSAVLFTGIDHD